uniref:Secreted protein n=1 Tax=Triticum urartu TaxID=4572 RepID=A0A8R7QFY6_TRIUA
MKRTGDRTDRNAFVFLWLTALHCTCFRRSSIDQTCMQPFPFALPLTQPLLCSFVPLSPATFTMSRL